MQHPTQSLGLRLNRDVWRDSLLFSLFAYLCTLPYLVFQLYGAKTLPSLLQQQGLREGGQFKSFIASQLGLLFFLLFLCTCLALVFRDRYQLPHFGVARFRENLRDRSLWWGCLGVLVGLPLVFYCSFIFFERQLGTRLPELYPAAPLPALAKALMNAFTIEIVGRLGLLTVAYGIFRRRLLANLAVSLFFCFLLLTTLKRYGVLDLFAGLLWLPLSIVFFTHLLLNLLYFRKGIFPCLALQFMLNLKYVFFLWLL